MSWIVQRYRKCEDNLSFFTLKLYTVAVLVSLYSVCMLLSKENIQGQALFTLCGYA